MSEGFQTLSDLINDRQHKRLLRLSFPDDDAPAGYLTPVRSSPSGAAYTGDPPAASDVPPSVSTSDPDVSRNRYSAPRVTPVIVVACAPVIGMSGVRPWKRSDGADANPPALVVKSLIGQKDSKDKRFSMKQILPHFTQKLA